jgi:hypothetical protein
MARITDPSSVIAGADAVSPGTCQRLGMIGQWQRSVSGFELGVVFRGALEDRGRGVGRA